MRLEKLLKRLKREFIKVNLLQASLDSIILFQALNLAFFLTSIRLMSGVPNYQLFTLITLVFFLGDLAYRAKTYRLEIYEEQNPELKEVLRTARDNIDQQNIVSQALFDEVLDRARSITSESIIPSKEIIQKILVVGGLSFLTVLSGITSFQIQEDGGELLPNVNKLKEVIEQQNKSEYQVKNASNIYGDSDDLNTEDLDLNFNVTGSGRGSGGGTESAVEEEQVIDSTPISSEENLELAKKYSLAIKELDTNR